jgi:hypothetical protein
VLQRQRFIQWVRYCDSAGVGWANVLAANLGYRLLNIQWGWIHALHRSGMLLRFLRSDAVSRLVAQTHREGSVRSSSGPSSCPYSPTCREGFRLLDKSSGQPVIQDSYQHVKTGPEHY